MTNADYDHAKWMAQAHLNGLPPADFDDWLRANLSRLVEAARTGADRTRELENELDVLKVELADARHQIEQIKDEVAVAPGAAAEECRSILGMPLRLRPSEVFDELNALGRRLADRVGGGPPPGTDGKVSRADLIECIEEARRTPAPRQPAQMPLTTGEAAKLLRVAPRVVRKWCDSGKLPYARKVTTQHRVLYAGDLRQFMAENGVPIPDDFPQ